MVGCLGRFFFVWERRTLRKGLEKGVALPCRSVWLVGALVE